ncbi:MAG TPA: universal stress protein [Propionibacteriaceae bacterium]|nr:universal stress protein [Propionibacteriaceae bacterium]
MTDLILLAVNDSPDAFHAAEVAVAVARRLSARLRAVSVVSEAQPADSHGHDGDLSARAALEHVTRLARAVGVEVVTTTRYGNVASSILEEAVNCDADLIIMARVGRPGHVLQHLGNTTQHVLEFATMPVLVVPARHPRWRVGLIQRGPVT